MCLHSAGQAAEAAHIIDSIARAVETGTLGDTTYTEILRADGLASYYAWTGDHPAAMRWLQYAFARSPMGVDRRVLESAIFDGLRADSVTAGQLRTLKASVWRRVVTPPPAQRR